MVEHSDDGIAELLAVRITTFIYAWNRPVERLARDVRGIDRFARPDGPLTPQLNLACAWPPLVPASSALIGAAIRIWGEKLQTTSTGRYLVATMALAGPIAAAEALVLAQPADSELLRNTADAFMEVFATYPDVYLEPARRLLHPFSASAGRRGCRSNDPSSG